MFSRILSFFSGTNNSHDDGVETYLDKYVVKIVGVTSTELSLLVDDKSVKAPLTDVEFIVAYRTNRIPDSPIHIDFWTSTGAIPLSAKMDGWDEFLKLLPTCFELQNYEMLELPPWTQNVMKSKVFALLYDTKSRDMMEVYNKYYG
jgi:hypothetical protein